MQLDTQKHEVSQYLRSAHANRHAEARVLRCMNTRHVEGQVDMQVSSGIAREHAEGKVYPHVLPCMQPEACGTTHRRLGGESLLAGVFYIYSAPLLVFINPKHLKTWEVPKYCPEEKEGSFQVLISPDQFIQDIEVGFCGLTSRYQDEDLEGIKRVPDIGDGFRARIAGPNLVVVLVVVYRSLLPQMPPASPIEDRGTAIPIEDRDRAIPERLRLCGIGNPGSLSETSSLTPHSLLQVTSRKDHSAREIVGAGVVIDHGFYPLLPMVYKTAQARQMSSYRWRPYHR
ncbi:hypothetical protein F2Q68_00041285 [Brassica cretica]|uniref:Uncharacterized protein n=1 Tax=Brassica cretica TaxID=69181 RepID=A0A8S9MLA4_BRACR|nr:hypothetical protein F2Q68_00041285 [Brassica cretica]